MTLHQMLDWTHCPIHREKLKLNCPRCATELGHFQLTTDFPLRARCLNCDWVLWEYRAQTDKTLEQARLDITAEYLQWQQEITAYFRAEGLNRRWYGLPTRYAELAHANLIESGSEWLHSCLALANSINEKNTGIALDRLLDNETLRDDPVQLELELRSGDEAWIDHKTKVGLTSMDHLPVKIQLMHKKLENRHPVLGERSGVFEMSSNHCVIHHARRMNCWATAHRLWRRCFDAAWPREEQWSRVRQPLALFNSALGRAWAAAFQGILQPHDPVDVSTGAGMTRYLLSDAWIESWLEANYYVFIAHSCRAIDLHALNMNDLGVHVTELGCMPLFAVKEDNSTSQLVRLSPMANPKTFIGLHKNGFKGNDQSLLHDVEVLSPILDAIGVHPKLRRRWRIDSVRLHRAQRQKTTR